MRKIIAAAFALLVPVLAHAQEPPAMPVSWWLAHPAERNRIIPQCQDNSRLARTANCVNAEAAGQGLRAQNTYVDLRAMVMDPRYWSANSIARDAELSRCAAGKSLYPDDCAIAARSALQDRR